MESIWGPQTDFDLSGDQLRDEVQLHLLRYLGDSQPAFIDTEAWNGRSREPGPPVDVLVAPPEGERRFAYVVSFGGSLRQVGEKGAADMQGRRLEFVLAAPQSGERVADRNMLNLAANTVRQFAKLAHLQPVRIAPGETVAFSENPEPMFEGSDQVAFAFLEPRLPADGFGSMAIVGGERVSFMAPVPIFQAELDAGHRNGPEFLARALTRSGVSEMLDFSRRPVLQPSWHRRGLVGRLMSVFRRRKG